jgi:hypothetical protein
MIGAFVMIFVALWIYQSAMQAKLSNVIIWVAAGVAAFFVFQYLLIEVNVYLLESTRSSEGGENYEMLNGGDRKNEGGFQGFGGILESLYFELMPQVVAFIGIAFLRLKFITKESFSIPNLFSGLKELFQGIKQSFKASINVEK